MNSSTNLLESLLEWDEIVVDFLLPHPSLEFAALPAL